MTRLNIKTAVCSKNLPYIEVFLSLGIGDSDMQVKEGNITGSNGDDDLVTHGKIAGTAKGSRQRQRPCGSMWTTGT